MVLLVDACWRWTLIEVGFLPDRGKR